MRGCARPPSSLRARVADPSPARRAATATQDAPVPVAEDVFVDPVVGSRRFSNYLRVTIAPARPPHLG